MTHVGYDLTHFVISLLCYDLTHFGTAFDLAWLLIGTIALSETCLGSSDLCMNNAHVCIVFIFLIGDQV